jgi:hypothetical protein
MHMPDETTAIQKSSARQRLFFSCRPAITFPLSHVGQINAAQPNCLAWDNEPIPLSFTFGNYCLAANGAEVYLTAE